MNWRCAARRSRRWHSSAITSGSIGRRRPPSTSRRGGQLGIGFSSAKIVRVWGRWRDATAALSGERDRSTVAERAYRRTYLGARRTREEPLAAVRMWLESHDGSGYSVDYDDWARGYNLTLDADALPVPRLSTIRHSLALSWSDVLAVARAERSHPEVAAKRRDDGDWSRGPHDLIAIRTIAHLMGLSETVAKKRTNRPDFPAAVLTLPGGRRAWLREDELADHDLNTMEVAELVGRSYQSQAKRYEVPPAGRVGGRLYWLRAEVKAWVAANEKRIAARKAKAHRPGTERANPTRDFLTVKDLRVMLGTSKAIATELARDPRFPKPVATFGNGRVWLRRDVEAFMTEQPFPARPENALQEKLIEADELSELLGVGRWLTDRRRDLAPPPAGRAGNRNFWVRADVEKWLDADTRRRERSLPASARSGGDEARHRARIDPKWGSAHRSRGDVVPVPRAVTLPQSSRRRRRVPFPPRGARVVVGSRRAVRACAPSDHGRRRSRRRARARRGR
jgi:predicted DNA-binding transcriptional regulator AlpA